MRKYRSKFEKAVAEKLGRKWKYEPFKLPYTSDHNYTPDFAKGLVIYEAKGRFRPGDTKKYKDMQRCNPEYKLIFIFMKPDLPLPGARRRKKCGTKQTHAEWADRNGFKWTTLEKLK